jgi:hypothetical protein
MIAAPSRFLGRQSARKGITEATCRKTPDSPIFTPEQRARFRHLRNARDAAAALSPDEQAELGALFQQIEDVEAAYLRPANERLNREVAEKRRVFAPWKRWCGASRRWVQRLETVLSELEPSAVPLTTRYAVCWANQDQQTYRSLPRPPSLRETFGPAHASSGTLRFSVRLLRRERTDAGAQLTLDHFQPAREAARTACIISLLLPRLQREQRRLLAAGCH